ncbi:MAG: Putative cryptic C4-dicarboxylate transporter DcuD [Desulfovibrio sp.]
MSIAAGVIIIAAMIYGLIKQWETRMVLFAGGMAMAIIAGQPLAPLISFSKSMKQANIFEVIIASMGFAAVVKATQCDKHLIAVFVKILRRMGPFLIIGVALATTVVNSSIPSAAGTSAAVGTIMIPLLISSGIPAPLAAGAVLCGLYGGNLNPGHVHPTLVAELAGGGKTGMDFVTLVAFPLLGSVVASSSVLVVIAYWMRKKQAHGLSAAADADDTQAFGEGFTLNPLFAVLPLLPLILLILGNMDILPVLKMPVSHAMIIGALVIMAITRTSPGTISNSFFKGMGESFGSIFGLIVAANIFVAGMNSLGLIKSLIDVMTTSPAIAKIASIFGPFAIAILSGSGEAAAIAFNNAVSVHAGQFGMEVMNMGAMTVLSGGIGRSMSLVSGCMIICAGIAKVTPIEVLKRIWIPMLAALAFVVVTLNF